MKHFREVAEKETRNVTVTRHDRLPPDQYAFFELYGMESGCSCRNVILNVTGRFGGHLATINHAFDINGSKDIDMPQTFLDPINKQSQYSDALLELFKKVMLDGVYA